MIKKIAGILGILFVTLFTSCETDFDVIADWEDITIVYGLLNQNDTVHYIKINKAFLGDGDLLEYAQTQDSTTYTNKLDVKLQEFDDNDLVREIPLDTTTIHNKEEGDFHYPDQIIYTTGLSNSIILEDNYTYKLLIINPETGKEVSSTISLVKDFSIKEPALNHQTHPSITFPNNNSSRKVEWYSAKNGKRYELELVFTYLEKSKNSDEIIEKSVIWNEFPSKKSDNSEGGQLLKTKFLSERFFTFVNDKVPYSDSNKENNIDYREAKTVDFVITVASNEFDIYMELYEPSNSIVQTNPDYTNIKNGKGLFASRYVKTRSFGVSQNTQIALSLLDLYFTNPTTKN
ncbi:MAG: hypothetical protein U9R32_04575 [Bacteroidota bacterium]|nr:hypothetical protein [Bacteroidota bacterium]